MSAPESAIRQATQSTTRSSEGRGKPKSAPLNVIAGRQGQAISQAVQRQVEGEARITSMLDKGHSLLNGKPAAPRAAIIHREPSVASADGTAEHSHQTASSPIRRTPARSARRENSATHPSSSEKKLPVKHAGGLQSTRMVYWHPLKPHTLQSIASAEPPPIPTAIQEHATAKGQVFTGTTQRQFAAEKQGWPAFEGSKNGKSQTIQRTPASSSIRPGPQKTQKPLQRQDSSPEPGEMEVSGEIPKSQRYGPRDFTSDEMDFLASKMYAYIKRKVSQEKERHGRPGFALWR
jgi:hypothetical protein